MITFGGRLSIILNKLSCSFFLYPAAEGDHAYLVIFVLLFFLCVSKNIEDFCQLRMCFCVGFPFLTQNNHCRSVSERNVGEHPKGHRRYKRG